MKIKTAIKILSILLCISFLKSGIFAQTPAQVGQEDVVISANITTDLYSQVTLQPQTVEIKQPSNVNITAINPNGSPKQNRNIQIYIMGNSFGTTISQPALTDIFGQTTGSVSSTIPGTYTVCTRDITEGYEISIVDCEVLYVIPLNSPTLIAEPQYTKGSTNSLMWNMTGIGIYQYFIQASTDIDFNNIYASSAWTPNQAYEFTNLSNGLMYFYRVKARNAFGGESQWSNTVYSVQDSSSPTIDILEISDIGENNTTEWDREYLLTLKYRIKDNIGITGREFWCISNSQGRYDCKYLNTTNGDIWTVLIKLKDLESYLGKLYNQYTFCVEAVDNVGNVNRNCEAKIEIPDKKTPTSDKPTDIDKPMKPVTQPSVTVINRVVNVIENFIDNTVGKLEPQQLQDLTVSTTVANITVGVGFLITLLGSIPYFFLQVILAMLSLLGFRKKGNITGYVYNSLTKEPVTQAIVRVYNENNELVWTDVTDSNGYYRTIDLEDSEYYIKVTARNYTFPSKIIFGKTDFPLENVYHGDPFLTRKRKIPSYSIPLDQDELSNTKKVLARFISRSKAIWRSLHLILFSLGLFFSIYAFQVSQKWWNYVIIILYIPAFISLILSFFNKRERYGFVRDEEGHPIEDAIVGLTENEFDKLISKRVTDHLGRYKFLVEKGEYNISVLNADLRVLNKEGLENVVVKKDGGSMLCPNIVVRRLEDTVSKKGVDKPLKEL